MARYPAANNINKITNKLSPPETRLIGINMKKEEKIYRVQLVLNDTIKSYENEEVNVFQTENEQEAKRVFEKLSENKNLKYILR